MNADELNEFESLVRAEGPLDSEQLDRLEQLTPMYDAYEHGLKAERERKALAERLNLNAPIVVESTESFDDDEADAGNGWTRSDVWDLDVVSRVDTDGAELMSRAIDAAAQTPGPTDRRREALTGILERNGDEQMARLALATTSPAYKRAFGKVFAAGGEQYADLDDSEKRALRFAKSLGRAMSVGTDAGGGYLVPTDIEPAVTLTADGTNNPIYGIARREQTTSDVYRVVGSPNAAWSWDGENTEVSDDTPTFTNTDIPLYVAQGFVPVSFRAQQAYNAIGIAQTVLNAGYNDLVGAALTVGTGSSQPTGIVTAITGSATASATTDTFAVGDVYAVHEALAARHRRNATWMANIQIVNEVRQFATDDGHALLARLADGTPGALLGSPLVENEDMDGTYGSGDNYVLAYGDFMHFVIAEAMGTMVRIVPDVFGANGRPIGASGVYMQTSFGSDSVNDGAFALLNVT